MKPGLLVGIGLLLTISDVAVGQEATRPSQHRDTSARSTLPRPSRPIGGRPPGAEGPAIQPPRPNPYRPEIPPTRPSRPHPPGKPGYGANRPRPPHRPSVRPPSFKPIHRPGWRYPPGYSYRRWAVGQVVPRLFLSQPYSFRDYASLNLGGPPNGYRWVRYGPDLILVNTRTGRIRDVVYKAFY